MPHLLDRTWIYPHLLGNSNHFHRLLPNSVTLDLLDARSDLLAAQYFMHTQLQLLRQCDHNSHTSMQLLPNQKDLPV